MTFTVAAVLVEVTEELVDEVDAEVTVVVTEGIEVDELWLLSEALAKKVPEAAIAPVTMRAITGSFLLTFTTCAEGASLSTSANHAGLLDCGSDAFLSSVIALTSR